MADKDWKRWEREAAGDLGGYRTGPRGFNLPDISGLRGVAVECKLQAKLALRNRDLEQAETNAGAEPWALLLKEKKTGRKVAVVDYKFFVILLNLYNSY